MELSPEEIQTRNDLYKEAGEIAEIYDRILTAIYKTESEKQALKALRKLKIHMEVFERQNFHFGRLN